MILTAHNNKVKFERQNEALSLNLCRERNVKNES